MSAVLAHAVLEPRKIGLRKVEGDLDRLNFRDGDQAGRIVGAHLVAGIDDIRARLAVDRRIDARVSEIELGAIERGFVGFDSCRKRFGIGHELVALLRRHDAAIGQHHGAIGVRLGAFELCLVARHLRFGLTNRGFERCGIDLEQQIALPDHLAFFEFGFEQRSVDLRFDVHDRIGKHGSDRANDDRNVANLSGRNTNRRRLRAARATLAGVAAAAENRADSGERTLRPLLSAIPPGPPDRRSRQ